ncbi:MAG: hypothetical protein IPL99_28900 [Candidatus Competibacteraceae bacterium]|nr:hypothetical protein [Candidatus Competibacteraceae bacterium]
MLRLLILAACAVAITTRIDLVREGLPCRDHGLTPAFPFLIRQRDDLNVASLMMAC